MWRKFTLCSAEWIAASLPWQNWLLTESKAFTATSVYSIAMYRTEQALCRVLVYVTVIVLKILESEKSRRTGGKLNRYSPSGGKKGFCFVRNVYKSHCTMVKISRQTLFDEIGGKRTGVAVNFVNQPINNAETLLRLARFSCCLLFVSLQRWPDSLGIEFDGQRMSM